MGTKRDSRESFTSERLDDGNGSGRRMRIASLWSKTVGTEQSFTSWHEPNDNGGIVPPHVQAEAVQCQLDWRKLEDDWEEVSHFFKSYFPNRDWSLPVWCDDEQAKVKAARPEWHCGRLRSPPQSFKLKSERKSSRPCAGSPGTG